ncbi:hypothetical protein NA56DRAFT_293451 [Hyaloscypha hepaticicola]|uniref:Uncharacterized protein n=1 Tax=Hyaloscypha hepaticicola TaxID=2082293 RepID=A0A2J6QK40_9HELO|nr:hypothetical protein NA56DRAFT_293451 [Hyaloscypha hepaticicola]
MSHQAAAEVASTGIINEHNSNLHHQSPSQIHLQLSGSPVRDRSVTTLNPVSDGNFVPGSSALPAPARLARDALHHEFSSARSAMSPLTSETMNTAAQATMQSHFSEQAGESDMSASTQELHEGPPPSSKSPDNTVDTQGSLGAAGEERTVTLAGQICLRGTPSQNALLALIKEHVDIPNAVNPSLQTMELTDKLLPFYNTNTRPPDHNPYIPTYEDIQGLILPILKNGKITAGNKCITILRNVDDWYGSKGYVAFRGAAGEERTATLPGQKCLRGTPSQNALLALIEEKVDIPNAVDPYLQTMELTDKFLPFYNTNTRPPGHNPYVPTYEDIQGLILPILENGKITAGNKCITILRNVDDWYGSKGYVALRTAPKPENDSGLGDMSQSFQTPSLSRNPDSGVFPNEKRPA